MDSRANLTGLEIDPVSIPEVPDSRAYHHTRQYFFLLFLLFPVAHEPAKGKHDSMLGTELGN